MWLIIRLSHQGAPDIRFRCQEFGIAESFIGGFVSFIPIVSTIYNVTKSILTAFGVWPQSDAMQAIVNELVQDFEALLAAEDRSLLMAGDVANKVGLARTELGNLRDFIRRRIRQPRALIRRGIASVVLSLIIHDKLSKRSAIRHTGNGLSTPGLCIRTDGQASSNHRLYRTHRIRSLTTGSLFRRIWKRSQSG